MRRECKGEEQRKKRGTHRDVEQSTSLRDFYLINSFLRATSLSCSAASSLTHACNITINIFTSIALFSACLVDV